jgi:hypothetical protein
MKRLALIACGLMLIAPGAAQASDDAFEFWINPSIGYALDDNTAIELETAQRLRSTADGRADTYFFRLWVSQDVSDRVTLSGAVERRINDGGRDETRTMQQLSLKNGVLRGRFRLEQRFVSDADRMGVRLRPRVGVSVPLSSDGDWTFESNAELFITLRSNSRAGDQGLTGLRTQIAIGYDVSKQVNVSLGYLRQQDIRPNRADQIGNAPIVGIEFSF